MSAVSRSSSIWFDSHCHFDFPEFDGQRDRLVHQLAANQCGGLVVPGINTENWIKLLELKQQYSEFVHIALGLHPYFMEHHQQSHILKLREYLDEYLEQVVAVGEIGLDFHPSIVSSDIECEEQLMFFNEQISVAKEYKLPLIIHSRKAHDIAAKSLRSTRFSMGGIVHGFSGSIQQAKAFCDLGFVIGLGGALTHARANAMQKLVKALKPDQYVVETDAPDMRPAFALDEANSPLNLPQIIEQIAAVREESVQQVRQTSTANLFRVLPALGQANYKECL